MLVIIHKGDGNGERGFIEDDCKDLDRLSVSVGETRTSFALLNFNAPINWYIYLIGGALRPMHAIHAIVDPNQFALVLYFSQYRTFSSDYFI